jgi:hypothetical protein
LTLVAPPAIRLELPDREIRGRLLLDGPKEPLKLEVSLNAKVEPVQFAEPPKINVTWGQPPQLLNGQTVNQAASVNWWLLLILMIGAAALGATIRAVWMNSIKLKRNHSGFLARAWPNFVVACAAVSFTPVLMDLLQRDMSKVGEGSGPTLVFASYCLGSATLGSEVLQALLAFSRRTLGRINRGSASETT